MIAVIALALVAVGVVAAAAVAAWSAILVHRDRRAEHGVPGHRPRHALRK